MLAQRFAGAEQASQKPPAQCDATAVNRASAQASEIMRIHSPSRVSRSGGKPCPSPGYCFATAFALALLEPAHVVGRELDSRGVVLGA